jgi:hypothetical protein
MNNLTDRGLMALFYGDWTLINFHGEQSNTYSKKLCNVIENVLNYKNKAKKENIAEKEKARVIEPIRQMESSN